MMKHRCLLLALVILGVLSLSCSVPGFLARAPEATPVPARTLRPTFTPMPSATNTLPPTPTPIPTDTPLPTSTPIPPSVTPEPPTSAPPTDTSEPPTDTPEPPTPTPAPPTATTRPQPTRPPQPTRVPPTEPPAARHVVGSHGVSGLVTARDKTTFAVGETAFFIYEALNHTQDPIGFVKLGITAGNGQLNVSWVNPDVLVPGVAFKHDDGLTFNSPGTYQVRLFICFDRCGEADEDWEEFPHGAATITVN